MEYTDIKGKVESAYALHLYEKTGLEYAGGLVKYELKGVNARDLVFELTFDNGDTELFPINYRLIFE